MIKNAAGLRFAQVFEWPDNSGASYFLIGTSITCQVASSGPCYDECYKFLSCWPNTVLARQDGVRQYFHVEH